MRKKVFFLFFFFLQLYELMVMAFKYQVFLCPRPKDLLLISYNHIDTIREFVKDTPVVVNQVDETHRKIIEVLLSLNKPFDFTEFLQHLNTALCPQSPIESVQRVQPPAVSFYHLLHPVRPVFVPFDAGILIIIRGRIPASPTNAAHIFPRHACSSESSVISSSACMSEVK